MRKYYYQNDKTGRLGLQSRLAAAVVEFRIT